LATIPGWLGTPVGAAAVVEHRHLLNPTFDPRGSATHGENVRRLDY
jgi:hypothetical protein